MAQTQTRNTWSKVADRRVREAIADAIWSEMQPAIMAGFDNDESSERHKREMMVAISNSLDPAEAASKIAADLGHFMEAGKSPDKDGIERVIRRALGDNKEVGKTAREWASKTDPAQQGVNAARADAIRQAKSEAETAALALGFAAQGEINQLIDALEQTREALAAGDNLQAVGAFTQVDLADLSALMRVLAKHARR